MTEDAPRPRHIAFSPTRIVAIASNTLLELVRLKVFYFLVIFGLAMIASSLVTVNFTFQEQFQVLKDVSLGAMSIFTWLLATLATSMLLPKDLEDRTLYTILAKPVPRLEYLLGKLAGVLLMLFVALLIMSVLFVIVLYWREHSALNELRPGPDLEAETRQIKNASFNSNLIPGIILIYTKAAVVASVTLLLSTFATSSIFTVIISVAVYFIGHVQPLAREVVMTQGTTEPTLIAKGFFAIVAILFPDFQLFNLIDDIAVGSPVPMGIFSQTMGWGIGYIFIYTLVGYLFFSSKEL